MSTMDLILTVIKNVSFSTWLLLGTAIVSPGYWQALGSIALVDKFLSRWLCTQRVVVFISYTSTR